MANASAHVVVSKGTKERPGEARQQLPICSTSLTTFAARPGVSAVRLADLTSTMTSKLVTAAFGMDAGPL
jgi:hypothetical protein